MPPSSNICRSSSSQLVNVTFLIFTFECHFPGGTSGKESTCQCRRCRFHPCVGKIPWRRKWQPTPVFLPGKSLVGYSPLGLKESDKTEWLHFELWAQNRPCFPGKIREKANYSVTLPKCLPVMSTLNNNITKNHVKQIIDQQNLFTTN